MADIGRFHLFFTLMVIVEFISHKSAHGLSRIRCPLGPKGDIGSPGPKGSTGLPGVPGRDGFPGQKGDSCSLRRPSSDPHVVKGSKGDPGFSGMPGLPGQKGAMGYPGERGSAGYPGRDGFPGRDGHPGPDGVCLCPLSTTPATLPDEGLIPRNTVAFYGHAYKVMRPNSSRQFVQFSEIVTNEGGLFNPNATENQTDLVIPESGVYVFHLTPSSLAEDADAIVLVHNNTVAMQSGNRKDVNGLLPVSTNHVVIRANAGEDLQLIIERNENDENPTEASDTHVTLSAYLIG